MQDDQIQKLKNSLLREGNEDAFKAFASVMRREGEAPVPKKGAPDDVREIFRKAYEIIDTEMDQEESTGSD